MFNKLPAPWEQGAAAWSITEPANTAANDGPLAVLSAMLSATLRHKEKVALWILFCVGVAFIYAYTATPSYTATATLILEPRRPAMQGAQDSSLALSFDNSRAEGELQVLKSERLLATVFDGLNLMNDREFQPQSGGLLSGLSNLLTSVTGDLLSFSSAQAPNPAIVRQVRFEAFASRVSVRRIGQSYVAEISYTANDPTLARRVANAAASAYLLQSISAKADAAKNGAEFLQGRLNALSAQARAASAAIAAGMLPETPTPDADARVIGAALQPLRPSAPRKTLVVILGAMVGLVGGFLGVALWQAFDRRLHTAQDVTRQAGLPCLAVLPKLGVVKRSRWPSFLSKLSRSGSTEDLFAKGMRDLRASVQLAVASRPGDADGVAIALMACSPGAGTSLISFHLARLISQSGRPVTLIDGDMQNSAIRPVDDRYGWRNTQSLADLLDDSRHLDELKPLDRAGIAVIPSQSSDAEVNRRVDLSASALQTILERLRQAGTVILDLPSLSKATEARAAARRANFVVLVAEAERTTVDELVAAASALRGAGANLIGVVLNRA